MRGSTRILALIVLALTAGAGALVAQSTVSGSLQGRISDAEGNALPGVTITISSDALIAREMTTTSDERGAYRFPSLPVGVYAITASLDGFQTARQDGIRIRLASTLAVDLVLQLATVTEVIEVTASAPIVSVVNNTVSTSFDAQYLETQPIQRNYYQIIKAAPGVNADYTSSSGSAMLAYGGTSESQNAFTLDGVNVADAGAGQHWILPSIQWMEEVQIGGLGANAEYGGYTGGVINGVTKSGGNTMKGAIEVFYQPSSWVADNTPDTPDEEFKFEDYAASLGGPVLKDRLWYFVSGEYWHQVSTPYRAVDTSDRKIPRLLGKLTWQANPANRLFLMTSWDAVTNERRGISESTLPEASSKQKGPGTSISLGWESLINSANFVNVRLTGYDGRDDYLPYHGEDLPGRIDEDTGISWVNQDIRERNHRRIVTLDASWSLFADDLFGRSDTHSFKFGALYEDAVSSDRWRRNGGFTYYDDSSECDSFAAYLADPSCGAYYIERGWGEYDAHPRYDGWAAYAQDSVRFDRVTVNAGVRVGGYDAGWQKGHGNRSVYDVTYVDPRLGAVWDVRGDARTAVKLHWGRYHNKMFTYLYDREISGHAAIPDMDCYWDEDTGGYTDCDEPTVIAAPMGKHDLAYVDEALFSVEQQFGADILLGFDFADRRFKNIMAMVNVNEDYELLTGSNPLTGGALPIWNLLSEPEFVLTTRNGAYRDFQSATLRFEKRYSHGWSGRASIVWTDLDGNILKNNGYANEWRDRNGLYNADGRLDLSYSEWEFKLTGAFDLPANFQVGGQYTYLSGWYWTPYGRVTGLDYNSSVGRDIKLVPRGARQLDDRQLLDLRLAWRTELAGQLHLTASLEVFNAFNSDTVIDVYDRYGTYRISRNSWSPRDDFGTPYQIERPREIRVGLRFEF